MGEKIKKPGKLLDKYEFEGSLYEVFLTKEDKIIMHIDGEPTGKALSLTEALLLAK